MEKLRENEQGADKKRIGQTLRRWLGWSIVGTVLPLSAFAAPLSPLCNVSLSQLGILQEITDTVGQPGDVNATASTPNPLDHTINTVCYSLTPPNVDLPAATACAGSPDPFTVPTNTPFYLHSTDPGNLLRCTYLITIDPTDMGGDSISLFTPTTATDVPNPTAVPIFTPIGLIATIGGLLWFGRRRAIKLKSS